VVDQKKRNAIGFFLLGIMYILIQGWPAYQKVSQAKHGRDYSSFYYAQKISWEGKSPYQSKNLTQQARREKTRKRVHPYFYPPPAIFLFLWNQPFSLYTSYMIFFVINQFLVVGLYLLLKRWLNISWLLLGILFIFCTPISDSIMMGQVNVIILFLILWSLQKNKGAILSAAAMIKMSPALLLLPQIIWKKWRFVGWCISFALIFSIISLPIIDFEIQKSFYLDVLPQFSSGKYSGLKVPFHLKSNHSLPELCAQFFPAEKGAIISPQAKTIATCINGIGILGLSILAWKKGEEKNILGAFVVLMVLFPMYTYEHHLVFLIFPAAVLLKHCINRSYGFQLLSFLTLFFLFWPLSWWRLAQKTFPSLQWWFQESKCLSALLLMFLLCYVSLYSKAKAR